MSGQEDEKIRHIGFLKQETAEKRGKNTCYPTSLVNAAIAVGAVTTAEAETVHNNLISRLIDVPDLWNGPNMNISWDDPQIADVIEAYLHVDIGYFDSDIGKRVFLAPRTCDKIYDDLVKGEQAHVIPVRGGLHAYAFRAEGGNVSCIDPLNPMPSMLDKATFARVVDPSGEIHIGTTIVKRKQGPIAIIVGPGAVPVYKAIINNHRSKFLNLCQTILTRPTSWSNIKLWIP